MAIATKIFDFNSGPQGWQIPADGYAAYFDNTNVPPGVLGVNYAPGYTGSGNINVSDNFIWDGTWEDLGVPMASIITQIQLTSVKREVTSLASGGSVTAGPMTMHYSGNSSTLGTLFFSRSVSTVDSTWDITSGTPIAVPSDIQLSNSPVEFQIFNNSSVGGTGSNNNYYDDITLDFTYTPGVFGSGNLPTQNIILIGSGTASPPIFSGSGNLIAKTYLSGQGYPSGTGYNSGDCSLFISGTLPFSGDNNITLYELGNGYEAENFPLYVKGIPHYTNDLLSTTPLITTGFSPIASGINLYVSGPRPLVNSIPLYIAGPSPTTVGLNLFIRGTPASRINSLVLLNIYGALVGGTNPSWIGSIPLFMGKSLGPSESLNLFISGVRSAAPTSSSLNLSILSDYPQIAKSIPLIVWNQQESISRFLPLRIKGAGLNSGYYPINSSVNLVTTGYGSGPYASPLAAQSNFPLFIMGNLPASYNLMPYNIVTLFLQSPYSFPAESSTTLFVSGAVPAVASNDLDLFLKGLFNGTIPLFIHGF